MTKSSSRRLLRAAAAFGLWAAVLLGVGGCASMRDPDGTDLPWTDRQGWELQPNLPGSMVNP